MLVDEIKLGEDVNRISWPESMVLGLCMLLIDDYNELVALNRALMVARYHAVDVDEAARGSAFLAAIHERVIDEFVSRHEIRGEFQKAEDWRGWRKFSARTIERPLIVEYLSRVWPGLSSPDVKRRVVENQLKPFEFAESEVRELIAELDRRG